MTILVIGNGEKGFELMIPLIGNLYRNGINILIYGQSLVNNSSSEI